MMELIQKIGFLPLLDSGIEGFSAEDIVAEDCGYVRLPEGRLGLAAMEMEGRDCAGNAMYVRKVLQQESRIHQPRMVA